MKTMLIATVACALFFAWFFRWEIVAAPTTDNATAYVLDRWTGTVMVLSNGVRLPVRDVRTRP